MNNILQRRTLIRSLPDNFHLNAEKTGEDDEIIAEIIAEKTGEDDEKIDEKIDEKTGEDDEKIDEKIDEKTGEDDEKIDEKIDKTLAEKTGVAHDNLVQKNKRKRKRHPQAQTQTQMQMQTQTQMLLQVMPTLTPLLPSAILDAFRAFLHDQERWPTLTIATARYSRLDKDNTGYNSMDLLAQQIPLAPPGYRPFLALFASTLPAYNPILLFEMDNDNNQVVTVVLLLHKPTLFAPLRHFYLSHAPALVIQRFDHPIFHIIDKILFSGKTHHKRNTKISKCPVLQLLHSPFDFQPLFIFRFFLQSLFLLCE